MKNTNTKSMGNCLVCGQPVMDPNCGWGQGQPIHMDGRGCFDRVNVARPSEGGPAVPTVTDRPAHYTVTTGLKDGDEYPVIIGRDGKLSGGMDATTFHTEKAALEVAAMDAVWEDGTDAVYVYEVTRDAKCLHTFTSQSEALAALKPDTQATLVTGFYAGMRLDTRDGSGLVLQGGRLVGAVHRGYHGLPSDQDFYWSANVITGYGLKDSGQIEGTDGDHIPSVDFSPDGEARYIGGYSTAEDALQAILTRGV